MLPKGRHITP